MCAGLVVTEQSRGQDEKQADEDTGDDGCDTANLDCLQPPLGLYIERLLEPGMCEEPVAERERNKADQREGGGSARGERDHGPVAQPLAGGGDTERERDHQHRRGHHRATLETPARRVGTVEGQKQAVGERERGDNTDRRHDDLALDVGGLAVVACALPGVRPVTQVGPVADGAVVTHR